MSKRKARRYSPMTGKMDIRIKRVYAAPLAEDGLRVLVDRLWPRGVSKDKARLDAWIKDIAPSGALRKWFGHDPSRWKEFRARYVRELDGKKELVRALVIKARKAGALTMLYSSSDEQHNNAVVLKDVLQGREK